MYLSSLRLETLKSRPCAMSHKHNASFDAQKRTFLPQLISFIRTQTSSFALQHIINITYTHKANVQVQRRDSSERIIYRQVKTLYIVNILSYIYTYIYIRFTMTSKMTFKTCRACFIR